MSQANIIVAAAIEGVIHRLTLPKLPVAESFGVFSANWGVLAQLPEADSEPVPTTASANSVYAAADDDATQPAVPSAKRPALTLAMGARATESLAIASAAEAAASDTDSAEEGAAEVAAAQSSTMLSHAGVVPQATSASAVTASAGSSNSSASAGAAGAGATSTAASGAATGGVGSTSARPPPAASACPICLEDKLLVRPCRHPDPAVRRTHRICLPCLVEAVRDQLSKPYPIIIHCISCKPTDAAAAAKTAEKQQAAAAAEVALSEEAKARRQAKAQAEADAEALVPPALRQEEGVDFFPSAAMDEQILLTIFAWCGVDPRDPANYRDPSDRTSGSSSGSGSETSASGGAAIRSAGAGAGAGADGFNSSRASISGRPLATSWAVGGAAGGAGSPTIAEPVAVAVDAAAQRMIALASSPPLSNTIGKVLGKGLAELAAAVDGKGIAPLTAGELQKATAAARKLRAALQLRAAGVPVTFCPNPRCGEIWRADVPAAAAMADASAAGSGTSAGAGAGAAACVLAGAGAGAGARSDSSLNPNLKRKLAAPVVIVPRPQRAQCSACQCKDYDLCAVCLLPWEASGHTGISCAAAAVAMAEALKDSGKVGGAAALKFTCRPCHRCKTQLSHPRGHGCHIMKCPCGATMCYNCGSAAVGHRCTRSPPCPTHCSSECVCADCSDCRPGAPCSVCYRGASCWVCAGVPADIRAARDADRLQRWRALDASMKAARERAAAAVSAAASSIGSAAAGASAGSSSAAPVGLAGAGTVDAAPLALAAGFQYGAAVPAAAALFRMPYRLVFRATDEAIAVGAPINVRQRDKAAKLALMQAAVDDPSAPHGPGLSNERLRSSAAVGKTVVGGRQLALPVSEDLHRERERQTALIRGAFGMGPAGGGGGATQ